MTNEQEKVIIALKKCYDGDYDASFFRMAQWVIADRKAVLDRVRKPLDRIGKRTYYENIRENATSGNSHYWEDVKEALSEIDRAIKTMEM